MAAPSQLGWLVYNIVPQAPRGRSRELQPIPAARILTSDGVTVPPRSSACRLAKTDPFPSCQAGDVVQSPRLLPEAELSSVM